jgi:hypothetical protein
MIFPRRRVSNIVTALVVRRDVLELHPVLQEKFIGQRAMIGEGAHHRPVVVAVIRPAVILHDGPVGEIREDSFRRIFDTVFFLRASAAARGTLPPLIIAWPPMS